MTDRTVLVTGGAGYIGSHTCVVLLEAGLRVVVLDNLDNSSLVALERVRELVPDGGERLVFDQGDIREPHDLDRAFAYGGVEAVVHFAGLKAVGESVEEPLRYYDNNVAGTVQLLDAMERHDVRDLVFSSSCTVYGEPDDGADHRGHARSAPASPYGRTKLHIEEMLRDVAATGGWRIALLRYFNPVGAHPSGRIGEDPRRHPQQPDAVHHAGGGRPARPPHRVRRRLPHARRHRASATTSTWSTSPRATSPHSISSMASTARVPVNLGTGTGSSVLDVVRAASEAAGRDLPYEIGPRRAGDVVAAWADPPVRRRCSAGGRRARSPTCAPTTGAGSRTNPDGYRG